METNDAPVPTRDAGSEISASEPKSVVNDVDGGMHLRLPIIEESLEIGKAVVDRGGYRITKRVETHDQLVDELLRGENVQIERRAMNTPVKGDAVPGIRHEGDTLIVPVIEEVLVTVKRLVVVEEVRITRTHSTRHESQSHTLRKEHIDIERLAAEQRLSVDVS